MATVVLETLDHHLFEVRDKPALECTTIINEILKPRRRAKIGIGNIPLTAIALECKRASQIIEGRAKAVRLQKHALRHLRGPSFHGLAEDTVRNIACRQMSGSRKPVWTGTDDDNLTEFVHVPSLMDTNG